MTCRDVIDFLIDYCDGALSDAERQLFEAHLVNCPDCRAYLATYEQTVRLEKTAFSKVAEKMPARLVQAILSARKRGGS